MDSSWHLDYDYYKRQKIENLGAYIGSYGEVGLELFELLGLTL